MTAISIDCCSDSPGGWAMLRGVGDVSHCRSVNRGWRPARGEAGRRDCRRREGRTPAGELTCRGTRPTKAGRSAPFRG